MLLGQRSSVLYDCSPSRHGAAGVGVARACLGPAPALAVFNCFTGFLLICCYADGLDALRTGLANPARRLAAAAQCALDSDAAIKASASG